MKDSKAKEYLLTRANKQMHKKQTNQNNQKKPKPNKQTGKAQMTCQNNISGGEAEEGMF